MLLFIKSLGYLSSTSHVGGSEFDRHVRVHHWGIALLLGIQEVQGRHLRSARHGAHFFIKFVQRVLGYSPYA